MYENFASGLPGFGVLIDLEGDENRGVKKVKPIKTDPLTRANSDGKTYQRTPQVESQIVEALALDESELDERLDIRDFKTEGYFQEECLVYLIRRCHREDRRDLVNKLTERLIQRCARHINDRVSFSLDPIYVDDCFREVIAAAFGQILGRGYRASHERTADTGLG